MRRLITKDGQRLFKKMKAKIFFPGNHKHVVKEHRAPVGKGITEEGMSSWLKVLADAIEKQFPHHEYRLVQIGSWSFNFVWVRELEQPVEGEAVSA